MKKIFFLFALVATISLASCMKMNPVACFSNVPTTGKVGTSLTFASCSTDAHHEEWDFGDAATTTGTTVTHAYSKAGTFTVKLAAYNADKTKSDTKTTSITITQ
jgi:PKD repeat protein